MVFQPQVVKLAVHSHTNLGSENDQDQHGTETSAKRGVGMRQVLNVEWEWGWC